MHREALLAAKIERDNLKLHSTPGSLEELASPGRHLPPARTRGTTFPALVFSEKKRALTRP
jgi:hypothetical protein